MSKISKLSKGKTVQFTPDELYELEGGNFLSSANIKKIQKAIRNNKGSRIKLNDEEIYLGGSFFGSVGRSISRSANRTGRAISRSARSTGRAIKKVATKENLNKAVDGLRYANSAVQKLTGKKPSDMLIDEVLGRVATPVIGATATKMLSNEAKKQAAKQGFGINNPYMPRRMAPAVMPDDIDGGSFKRTGGSFNRGGFISMKRGNGLDMDGGSFKTNTVGGSYKEPNNMILHGSGASYLNKKFKLQDNMKYDLNMDHPAMNPTRDPPRGVSRAL